MPATLFDVLIGVLFGLYIVISSGIDVVHSRGLVSAVMGYAITRLTGKKFIFDVRGLMAEEYADGGMWPRNGFLYRVSLYIEKKLLCQADRIVVLSENIKDFLLNSDYLSKQKCDIVRKKITVIPCCVDTERFNKESDLTETLRRKYKISDKFVFLYIGSVGTWYLLEQMIDFFVVAKTLISNAHFLLLTHVDKDAVISAWRKRDLSFDDISIDDAEFSNIPYYIKLADVGMFFIKPCLSKRSSCPIKFSEYLACGLPVLINKGIGDTDKIVRDNEAGVVIESFDNASYAKGLKDLIKLKSMNDGLLSKRCRSVAEGLFSLRKGTDSYFNVYSGLFRDEKGLK